MSRLNDLPAPQNCYNNHTRSQNLNFQSVGYNGAFNGGYHGNSYFKNKNESYYDHNRMDQDYQCQFDEMEVIDSANDTNCGSMNNDEDDNDEEVEVISSDEEVKCKESVIDEMDDELREIEDSLRSINYFGSGLDGNDNNYWILRNGFHDNPLKWVQIINFLIQIHYDMGHPALKPNIISLAAEYLAYLTNKGHFDHILKKQIKDDSDLNVRRNVDIRMAVFEAVKYDQGFQMNISKLFDLNYYSKPMVFSNNKKIYNSIKNGDKTAINNNQFKIYCDDEKNNEELIDWLRIKEIDFCNKIDWKFSFSSRYQLLMIYLKRLGFDTDCVISQQYKKVKIEYNRRKNKHLPLFDDNIKFGFLCRYLLEMTYYKPDFYSFSKTDLIISVIYSGYIIAQRWQNKFNFNNLFSTKDDILYKLLDNKHPRNNEIIYNMIKKILRIGRAPHSCNTYCTPIYYGSTHYHQCKCILNCCLNTYLKFSKMAFCEISKMPCLSTSNLNKFADWIDNKENKENKENIDPNNPTPMIRAFASNKSILQLST